MFDYYETKDCPECGATAHWKPEIHSYVCTLDMPHVTAPFRDDMYFVGG